MKQIKRRFSVKSAETAATFFYENSIQVILSWLDESFFGGTEINVVLILPAEALPLLNLQTYIKP